MKYNIGEEKESKKKILQNHVVAGRVGLESGMYENYGREKMYGKWDVGKLRKRKEVWKVGRRKITEEKRGMESGT